MASHPQASSVEMSLRASSMAGDNDSTGNVTANWQSQQIRKSEMR